MSRNLASMLTKVVTAVVAALLCSTVTYAQEYPSRPVTLIYPFSPGGGGDATARHVARELGTLWKQSVVVENRPGGSGMLGYNAIKNGRPDGYTLAFLHNGLTVIRRSADPNFTADVGKDYEAVTNVFESYTNLTAHPSAPFKNLRGFMEYVKANPGKVNVAMGGQGATDHIAAEMLKQQFGLDFQLISYNGSARAITAVIAGEVHAIIVSIPLANQVKAGQLVPLGVATPQRIPALAEWPTFTEAGYGIFQGMNNWVGLFAPPGTPKEILAKISRDLNTLFKNPELRKQAQVGGDLIGGTPEETAARVRKEIETMGPTIRKLGLKFE